MKIPTALLFPALAISLAACDDPPPPPPAQNNADNPLIKLQDDTVKKAQESLDSSLEKTQQALDNVDKM